MSETTPVTDGAPRDTTVRGLGRRSRLKYRRPPTAENTILTYNFTNAGAVLWASRRAR